MSPVRRSYWSAVGALERVTGSGGILTYHYVGNRHLNPDLDVHASTLRCQLEMAADRYEVIPLSELVDRFTSRRSVSGYVAVTFDDAYAGAVQQGLDVCRDLGLHATVFVTTGAVEDGAFYWWDVIDRIRAEQDESAWSRLLHDMGMGDLPPDGAAREEVKAFVLDRHRGDGAALSREFGSVVNDRRRRPASVEALRSAADRGGVDFGLHTVRHPALPLLDPEEQRWEIAACYRWLRERLPRVRPYLAYPYGLYDASTMEAARSAGVQAAFSAEPRPPSRRDTELTLPRYCLGETSTPQDIRAILSPLHGMVRVLLKGRDPALEPAVAADA